MTDLGVLLQSLQTPNNEVRSRAETVLSQEYVGGGVERQAMLLVGLAELATAGDAGNRVFAGVLLRRYINRPDPESDKLQRLADVVPAPARNQIRELLLRGLVAPDQPLEVRHKLADAIAELARKTSRAASAEWPELVPALFAMAKNEAPEIRESAFRILATTPQIIDNQVGFVQNAAEMLHSGFNDSSELVRVAAVTAFTAFFQTLPKEAWQMFKQLLPALLNVMEPLRQEYKCNELTAVLESLIELVNLAPKMFKPVFHEVIDFACAVASDKEMDEATRLSALEFAVSFVDEAPNMCRADRHYVEKMITQCLTMLVEVGEDDEDGADWNNEDDAIEDEEEIHTSAKAALDRLALRLAGDVIVPPLFQYLPEMLGSSEWRQRHGALMALSNVAEGCRDVMVTEFDKILDFVLPLLQDPHSRVQWAACNAIGQMSTDFATEVQEGYGPRILPALIAKLNNKSTFRVQAHAAAAIVNFSERATREVMDPYLDEMLSCLLQLLQGPKRYVQEQVLTTIAIVADAAQNAFIKYYDTLMPLIFSVMKADTGNEYQLLKAKAIECASLIAVAVHKEKFQPHFQETVQLFALIQQQAAESDPCQSYLAQAWCRLCRLMGTDFLPCLPGVMPPLLAAAKAKADCHILDEEQAAAMEGKEGWEVLRASGQYVGIHTATFEDKAGAIELLSVYASELGADFYPYVPEILRDVAIPGLSFFYFESVRYESCQLIPHLLTSAQFATARATGNDAAAKNAQQVVDIWLPCLDRMLQLIAQGETPGMLAQMYLAMYQAIELIGVEAQPLETVGVVVDTMQRAMVELQSRLVERSEAENDEFIEDPEEEEAVQDDNELVDAINKLVHATLKLRRGEVLPQIEQLLPLVSTSVSGQTDELREWGLSIIDDIIEYGGAGSAKYAEAFAEPLIRAVSDEDADVRQAGCYGIGVAAQHGGPAYTQLCVGSLQPLFTLINRPGARSEDNIGATENAIAAIAKILRYHGDQLGGQLEEALTAWIKALPIVDDEEAAPFAYLFLADLMGQKHPAVVKNFQHAFYSVARALAARSLTGKRAAHAVAATKALLAEVPSADAMELFNALSATDQEVVQSYFN